MITPYDRPLDYQFEALPFDDIFKAGAVMQDQENKAREESLKLANKEFQFLPGDKASAERDYNWLKGTVEPLFEKAKKSGEGMRGAYDDIYNLRRESEKRFNEFSEDAARRNRLAQYNAINKSIVDDKNMHPLQRQYYLDQLKGQANTSANFDPQTGNYQSIQAPQQFEWNDLQDWGEKRIKDVAESGEYKNFGFSGTPFDFQKAYREGTLTGVQRKNLKDYLAQAASSDPSLIQTQQVVSDYSGRGRTNEANFLKPIKDASGKVVDVDFNENTLIGRHLGALSSAASYQKENYNTKFIDDELGLHAAKKKIDDNIVRFSFKGMGINPQTVEKSSKDITNNIANINSSIAALEADKAKVAPNTPEANSIDAQIAWNKMQLNKRQQLYNKAQEAVNGKVNAEDKALFDKYGEWSPGDFSDPNYSRIINDMVSKGVIRNQSQATVESVMRYLGSSDPIKDAQKLSGAYNRKNKSIDDYLKNTSDSYTIQPDVITVDNTKDLSTSKAIEKAYNDGAGSWVLYDENGPVPLTERPSEMKINEITEQPIDELGYLFGGTEVITDDKGHKTNGKKYYLKPAGQHNINEKIGTDLIKENTPKGYDKTGEPIFEGGSKQRYEMGLNMVYPTYANQVSEVKEGFNSTILNGDVPVANITKEKTNHGIVYKVVAPDGRDGTFGSQQEVLEVLRKLEK